MKVSSTQAERTIPEDSFAAEDQPKPSWFARRCFSCQSPHRLSYFERPWPLRDLCLCRACLRRLRLILGSVMV